MKFDRDYNWLEVTRSFDEGTAAAISAHVAQVLERDSKIPRKYKELILLACSTAIRSGGSVRSHGFGALRHGATRAEILEAIALAAMPAGYSAFIEAIEAFGDELTAPGRQEGAGA